MPIPKKVYDEEIISANELIFNQTKNAKSWLSIEATSTLINIPIKPILIVIGVI